MCGKFMNQLQFSRWQWNTKGGCYLNNPHQIKIFHTNGTVDFVGYNWRLFWIQFKYDDYDSVPPWMLNCNSWCLKKFRMLSCEKYCSNRFRIYLFVEGRMFGGRIVNGWGGFRSFWGFFFITHLAEVVIFIRVIGCFTAMSKLNPCLIPSCDFL